MVILVRALSTCHVILLVLDNQHESKDIQRLHCHHRQRRALCQVIRVCLVTINFYA
ncbi:hypothetical protein K402DRAFT_396777 [Aulographum hederae CBS 113979]|uniref:Uncharacterized protein n=1 Tax=Aulographum hederae CBS 113979 TaxID=1176131 RepID=A0A6G1GQT6_9PEZI|nr:hypothetical protein K402DRAFT_396777 [Aulographum hederae CBS 113979]